MCGPCTPQSFVSQISHTGCSSRSVLSWGIVNPNSTARRANRLQGSEQYTLLCFGSWVSQNLHEPLLAKRSAALDRLRNRVPHFSSEQYIEFEGLPASDFPHSRQALYSRGCISALAARSAHCCGQ